MSINHKTQSFDQILSASDNASASPLSENLYFHGGILNSSLGDSIYLRQYHTIGRSKDCHTPLSRNDISRIHAVMFWQENGWYIQDKSTNGVWVNRKRIAKDQTTARRRNDLIGFNATKPSKACDSCLAEDI